MSSCLMKIFCRGSRILKLYPNQSRVSSKIKNIFLSCGDFTPNAFKYEEFWTNIAGLWTPDLSDHAIGFWFWDFIWGNQPKMGLKCAIFKICPKLVQKVI